MVYVCGCWELCNHISTDMGLPSMALEGCGSPVSLGGLEHDSRPAGRHYTGFKGPDLIPDPLTNSRVNLSTLCLGKNKIFPSLMGLLGSLAHGKVFRCCGKASAFPAVGSVLEAAFEQEGVNGDCVLSCQERLQPSGTLPSAEHGFSQPWGNEVIPQQVLFCLLSLWEEWSPWEQGSFQSTLGSRGAAGKGRAVPAWSLHRSLGSRKGSWCLTGFLRVRLPPSQVSQGENLLCLLKGAPAMAPKVPEPLEDVTGMCPFVEPLGRTALLSELTGIAICHTLSLWLWETGSGAVFSVGFYGILLRGRWAYQLYLSSPACHHPKCILMQQKRLPAFNLCSLLTYSPPFCLPFSAGDQELAKVRAKVRRQQGFVLQDQLLIFQGQQKSCWSKM